MMNEIGERYGIPPGGFPRGPRLTRTNDIVFADWLRKLKHRRASASTFANLERGFKYVPEMSPMLVLTTAAREYYGAPTARGQQLIETFDKGGLDFLGKNKNHLGLPKGITKRWIPVPPYKSPESHKLTNIPKVYPAKIPARDQVLAYAAQMRSSYANWEKHVKKVLGNEAGTAALNALTDESRAVWQAYAFLAPGGNKFNTTKPISSQHGGNFGVKSALGYLKHKAAQEGRPLNLNDITTDKAINGTHYVKTAKYRAAEADFFSDLIMSSQQRDIEGPKWLNPFWHFLDRSLDFPLSRYKRVGLNLNRDGNPDRLEFRINGDPVFRSSLQLGDANENGIPDHLELRTYGKPSLRTTTSLGDSDNNGIPDHLELRLHGKPLFTQKFRLGSTQNKLGLDRIELKVQDKQRFRKSLFLGDANKNGIPDHLELRLNGKTFAETKLQLGDANKNGIPDHLELQAHGKLLPNTMLDFKPAPYGGMDGNPFTSI